MPVYHFVDDVLEPGLRLKAKVSRNKIRTQQSDSQIAEKLKGFFGAMYLSHSATRKGKKLITGENVIAYHQKRLLDGVSESSVKRELAVASSVCNVMRAHTSMEFPNPFQGRLVLGVKKRRKRRIIVQDQWTKAEEGALLLAARPLVQDITTFALNTGLRLSEILHLTVSSRYEGEDYDRVFNGEEGWEIFFSPKDQKSGQDSSCALNETALAVLGRQHQITLLETDDFGLPLKHTYIFSWEGQKICRFQFSRWFRKDRKAAELDRLLFKNTRKTCGQRMLDSGATLRQVQSQLRHEKMSTTEDWYVVPSLSDAASAVKLIG